MTATIIKGISSQTEDLSTPFIESAKSIFSVMLGWKIEAGELSTSNRFQSKHEISGIIGFSGTLRGNMVIGMDQDFAFAVAEAFFGGTPTSIDSEIIDMVGELANMIGGNAKERLITSGVNLGLPMVICGKGHRVSFDPGAEVELFPFSCDKGSFTIEVAIRNPE